MIEVILAITGGLVLFLYGVNSLSGHIQEVLGENAKNIILKFTSNTFYAIITGIVVTAVLDSSSAVIIITIVFVNAKLLNLKQAMGIVLGANIGTTISSQIIALDFGKFSPIFLLIGFVFILVAKTAQLSNTGKAILYFGVLFFGLYTMENAVEPLKESPVFIEWLKHTEKPMSGALIGALVTLVIQSSSATVGMAIILTKKGLLSLGGGIAVMLGAELGTCSDTLLATIKGSRAALKTGLFHLFFNIVSIVLGLLLFEPFCTLVAQISVNASMERSLANAHMLFNTFGVLSFVWLIPLAEKLLNKYLPETNLAK
jgi:phosphate:Na+ symporter